MLGFVLNLKCPLKVKNFPSHPPKNCTNGSYGQTDSAFVCALSSGIQSPQDLSKFLLRFRVDLIIFVPAISEEAEQVECYIRKAQIMSSYCVWSNWAPDPRRLERTASFNSSTQQYTRTTGWLLPKKINVYCPPFCWRTESQQQGRNMALQSNASATFSRAPCGTNHLPRKTFGSPVNSTQERNQKEMYKIFVMTQIHKSNRSSSFAVFPKTGRTRTKTFFVVSLWLFLLTWQSTFGFHRRRSLSRKLSETCARKNSWEKKCKWMMCLMSQSCNR